MRRLAVFLRRFVSGFFGFDVILFFTITEGRTW
jgi:hypothetical protein